MSGASGADNVQRHDIEDRIKTDLEIHKQIAVLAEFRLEWAVRYHVKEIVEEFSKALQAELDYTIEGRNGDKIAKQFTKNPHIHIPDVYWDYTTKKVLTMEYVSGAKLNDVGLLAREEYNIKALAERLAHAVLDRKSTRL